MAKPNHIKNIERFIDLIWVEISTRFGEYATPKDIVYHLIERGIADPVKVRNYLILQDFDKLLVENEGHVTHSFMDLSIKYNLSDRQIQGIVYKYRDKFHKFSNIQKERRKDKKKSYCYKYPATHKE